MAEGAVTFLLNGLTLLLEKEAQLLSGIRVEVEYIVDELERIKAFLRVADAMEESDPEGPELKVWVNQVRDVAYDMEDVLDEFRLRLEHHDGHGFHAFLRKSYCFVKNLKARRRIASEIQGIKSRVNSISEGHQRYRSSNIVVQQAGSSSTSAGVTRLDSLRLKKADLVGIGEPKKQLVEWLVRGDSGCIVISVVGMGGLGKTTLVKEVYEDPVVKKHFKIYAWITVSRSFQIKELLKDLIQQLCKVMRKPLPRGLHSMNDNQLEKIIAKLLKQRRYLIVLDDVWRVNAWNDVKNALPENSFGSRIVLTTRIAEVATASCVESQGKIYNLKPLHLDDSWSLFCRKTFQGECPSHLDKICKSIVRRCGGLPLAIEAISGVLATKDRRSIDDWEIICRNLGAEIEDNERLENMERVLLLSYNDLPYYLKSCFLYLSIFPEDHPIEHMRLIRLWIAEGFVMVEQARSPEEVAGRYFKELLNRSLIQVEETTSDGRVKTCRIHDLLREIVISKSRHQNFATIVKEQGVIWPKKVRRLSILNMLHYVPQRKTFSRLRSLLVFKMGNSPSEFSTTNLFAGGRFRLLNVLDLRSAPLEMFPDDVIYLIHLRYLSLRDTKVQNIPSSIKKLQNLETFDLKHSNVKELPEEISELKKLRHLLVYHYKIESYAQFHYKTGFKALARLGSLQSLQKLCFIEVNQNSRFIMTEIGKLNQLRRLGIMKLKREDGMALCSAIEKLTNLRALSITSVKEDEIIDLQCLSSPPQYLQRLYLTGQLERLPKWIPSLHSLVKVYLKWSRIKHDPLEYLQDLPNLVHLEFLDVYDGETLHFKDGKFQSLKLLGLDQLDGLKLVNVDKGAMPGLEKLIIQRCELLQEVPSGIECLTNLKVLELFDMPDELIKSLHPNGEGKNHWKVQHIPEVYFTYRRDGGWDVYSLESFRDSESSSRLGIAIRSLENRALSKS